MSRIRTALSAGGDVSRLSVVIAAVVTFLLAGAAFAVAAPGGNPGGLNKGGHSPSGGNASCVTDAPSQCTHNPTEVTKTCTGGGCQVQLPDTPCDRGHGGVQAKNKHCGPTVLTPTLTATPTPTTSPTTMPTATPPPPTLISSTTTARSPTPPSGARPPGPSVVSPAAGVTPVFVSTEKAPTAAPAQAVTREAPFTG